MKKTTIIIGSLLAAFLLLIMPSVPALEYKTVKDEIEQIIADILGFFIGGPFLFISFSQYGYFPHPYYVSSEHLGQNGDNRGKTFGYSRRPWIRVKLGEFLCKEYGLCEG